MTSPSIRPSVDGFRQFSRGSWTVVEVIGEIDIACTPLIHRVLDDHPPPGRLVIDLTRVTFMDVSGLMVLVAAWKRAQAGGGELRIVVTAGPVCRLLEITGYDALLPWSAPWTTSAPDVPRPPDSTHPGVASAAKDSHQGQQRKVCGVPQPEPVSSIAPPLRGPVIMSQDWRDLTFVHWAVEPERVAHLMPPGVEVDTIGGSTYVGLVPFRMVDAGLGHGPRIPWLGTFLETNVRLYSVDATGRRGVVFLSLDADRAVVVAGARLALGLPYRWARLSHRRTTGPVGVQHEYDARLRGPVRGAASRLVVRVGPRRPATTLDLFLTARWGLHTRRLGRTLYIPNRHEPWPLHDAEVTSLDDGLVGSVGLGDLASRPPDHVAFSPGVHSVFGLPVGIA